MFYTNDLAVVMEIARSKGFISAICFKIGASTVMLPWIEAALVGPWTLPFRSAQVWFQAPWVLCLAVLSYQTFMRVFSYGALRSVVFSGAMISFAGVFNYNGGLSDFRMDLLQALLFGSSLCAYFLARSTLSLVSWTVFGILIGLCCLTRSTTPVYALIVYAPILAVDIVFAPHRAAQLKLYATSLIAALVVSGWFYILNGRYIFWYYLVFNVDAYARLPLQLSMKHVSFAMNHVGVALIAFGITHVIVEAVTVRLNLARLNWRALWAGAAPVAYLVFSGSGLNPYVSLVGAPCILLFLLSPFMPLVASVSTTDAVQTARAWREGLLALGAAAAAVFTASSGIAGHTADVPPYMPNRQALDQIVHEMSSDALQHDRHYLTFDVAYASGLVSDTLINHLIFEDRMNVDDRKCLRNKTMLMASIPPRFLQPVDWADAPGATDADKVRLMVDEAKRNADYALLPTVGSFVPPQIPIASHIEEVRTRLISGGDFAVLGDPIAVSPVEQVIIYRNTRSVEQPSCS